MQSSFEFQEVVAINQIAQAINTNISNVKLLDLGSPKQGLPVKIEYYKGEAQTFNFSKEVHKAVFLTVLGSIEGKNNVLHFEPKPVIMHIENCPNLETVDLGGGFAVMIREENPYDSNKENKNLKNNESSFGGFSKGFFGQKNNNSAALPSPLSPDGEPTTDIRFYMSK